MWAWLKSLPPRERRAEIALYASIGGTMGLTLMAVGITLILWLGGWPVDTSGKRIEQLGLIAVLVIVIMGITMTGLGLAINRRTLKANIGTAGFEASGGDEAERAASHVLDGAKEAAADITGKGV